MKKKRESLNEFIERAKGMTRDDQLKLKAELCVEKGRVDILLKEAQIERQETGQYADKDWHRRASFASKIIGQKLQCLQDIIGQTRPPKKRALPEYFVDVAKRLLAPDTVDMLFKEAEALRQERENGVREPQRVFG